jgi:hypothetical protein
MGGIYVYALIQEERTFVYPELLDYSIPFAWLTCL